MKITRPTIGTSFKTISDNHSEFLLGYATDAPSELGFYIDRVPEWMYPVYKQLSVGLKERCEVLASLYVSGEGEEYTRLVLAFAGLAILNHSYSQLRPIAGDSRVVTGDLGDGLLLDWLAPNFNSLRARYAQSSPLVKSYWLDFHPYVLVRMKFDEDGLKFNEFTDTQVKHVSGVTLNRLIHAVRFDKYRRNQEAKDIRAAVSMATLNEFDEWRIATSPYLDELITVGDGPVVSGWLARLRKPFQELQSRKGTDLVKGVENLIGTASEYFEGVFRLLLGKQCADEYLYLVSTQ